MPFAITLRFQGLFILQALVLIALPYLIWRLRWVRWFVPLVVVQIFVGLALGPSLLGRLWPAAFATFLHPRSLAALNGPASAAAQSPATKAAR